MPCLITPLLSMPKKPYTPKTRDRLVQLLLDIAENSDCNLSQKFACCKMIMRIRGELPTRQDGIATDAEIEKMEEDLSTLPEDLIELLKK